MESHENKLVSWVHKAAHFLPLVLFGIALAVVHQQVSVHPLGNITETIHHIPWSVTLGALALTALNYLTLVGYDILALRYTGNRLSLSRVTLASLISYAISNNTGHSWASGGSVRYRFYTAWGVPGWDVLKITLFLTITYLLGVLTLGLGGVLAMPPYLRDRIDELHMYPLLAGACVVPLALYWGVVVMRRKPVTIRGVSLGLPSPGLTFAQTVVSCADLVLASLVLWVFLPGRIDMGFETFIVIYVIAQVIGLISQVPGGIGVFEGVFLWLAGPDFTPDQQLVLIGALILYRVVYFFLPLLLAGIGLLAYEGYVRRHALAEGGRVVIALISGIVPQILSVLLLFTGGILLASGATPSLPENISWLRGFMPLPVIELSHLLASLTGLLLLFLARGILLRVDAAWYGAVLLLAVGAAGSLLKGFDWREAAILSAMFLIFLPCHGYFRRKSSLFDISFSPHWIVMILIVLGGAAWLGFFSYQHIDYADNLWWQFSYRDDAPRFLRAMLLVTITAVCFALYRLLGIARARSLSYPTPAELDEAAALVACGDDSQSFLVLTGDKKIFWSEDRRAFLMFTDTSRYWIAMGNPVGAKEAFPALLWRFKEDADRHGARTVFYEVGESCMPLYLDLGLTFLKIGEEAKIILANFSLEGGRRENLRKARNKFGKSGYTVTILNGEDVLQAMPRLRAVSDQWLARKSTREKGFSLGFFDEEYIARTPVAVARDPEDNILAFANIWVLDNKREISVDLMRYATESPPALMEYLFVELIMWAKAEGYYAFGLGMAPLAGLERHPLAPLWHKIGTAIFDRGDEFYNFEGLYAYKAKFDPEWKSRYLATPQGFRAPAILLQIAAIVAGGWKGILGR